MESKKAVVNAANYTGALIAIMLLLISLAVVMNGAVNDHPAIGGWFSTLISILWLFHCAPKINTIVCEICGNNVTRESKICPTCKATFK